MLSLFKNWIYNLIVRSRILHHFYWLASPIQFLVLMISNKNDTLTDDAGNAMNVTRWKGKVMAAFGLRNYSKIKNLNVRKDDVILCGYPKTGSHWTYEILYMIIHDKAEVSKNGKKQGFIEAMREIVLDSIPSPRILTTHLQYDDLPESLRKNNNKIVLTIRCPKDTVVSFYNHTKNLHVFYKYDGTFDNFFKMFVNGGVDFGCYFEFYRSWEEAMTSQNDNQICFLSFEDLKENPVQKIKEIAEFVGHPVSQEFAQEVAEVTSFSKLKEKRGNNFMFRKGCVGDWKNWLTEEQSLQVDKVWREKMSGFQMPSSRTYCS